MQIHSYADALAVLKGRQSRKVANNTYLQVRDPHTIALRLHATDILTWTDQPVDTITYNTGGWQTYVTKERLNRFGPLRIFSDRGSWYVTYLNERYCYTEGMQLQRATLLGVDVDQAAKTKALRKAVKAYAAGFMDALERREVEAPGAGDCWYCGMRTQGGTTLGEATPTLYPDGGLRTERNTDHLRSHMGEGGDEIYYVPSLLHRALEVQGASQSMWWWLGSYWDKAAIAAGKDMTHYRKGGYGYGRPRVEKALRKYILRQLGVAS